MDLTINGFVDQNLTHLQKYLTDTDGDKLLIFKTSICFSFFD